MKANGAKITTTTIITTEDEEKKKNASTKTHSYFQFCSECFVLCAQRVLKMLSVDFNRSERMAVKSKHGFMKTDSTQKWVLHIYDMSGRSHS